MRDKPWAVIDLLDEKAGTEWFETEIEAITASIGRSVTIQYRPGRKAKVKRSINVD